MRQRPGRQSTAASLVDDEPITRKPALPKRKGGWHEAVKAWWADVWTSPMAEEYVKSDIHGLYILADLMDRYWREPTTALATEIRLQRQCFGLTPIDRRRLQWEIQRGDEAERKRKPPVSSASGADDDPRGVLGLVR